MSGRRLRAAVAAILGCASLAASPAPHAAAPAATSAVTPPDQMVVTHGQVAVAGKPLRYSVRTGLLPLYDNDTGALIARMFVMAYVAERAPGAPPRPLTFVWNGGPGSSSSQVHLVGFGPKGFKTPATYPQWKGPPTQIVDRPETWLAYSDLVFVDPVGTGYSRVVSDAWRDVLYSQHGDGEAVAEAIRLYRTRYDAFDQPLILAGESYGTTRAMEVAADLARRRTPVAGVMLISGFFDVGQTTPRPLNQALELSMFTAAAWYHKRLPADLQAMPQDAAVREAVDWARTTYAPAIDRPEALSPEARTAVLAGLHRYTGLDPKYADPKTLLIDKATFSDRLLEDRDEELGRYDARMVVARRDLGAQSWLPTHDPSLAPMLDIMEGTSVPMIRYIRNTLGYRSDLLYRGPFGEAFHPKPMVTNPGGLGDDWMTLMWDRYRAPKTEGPAKPEGPPPAQEAPPLRRAMDAEPHMLVFNVRGMYDGDCAGLDEAVARAEPSLRARIRNRCYAAGHMVYTDDATRLQLSHDFAQFVRDATAAR
ncbi:MAG: S10 family serine carboxypeptidase-like protein [Phenylobacterium sp.]